MQRHTHAAALATAATAWISFASTVRAQESFEDPARGQDPPQHQKRSPEVSPSLERAFLPRAGLTIGVGLGAGGMSAGSGPIDCVDCDYQPAAGGIDFHIGKLVSPRLALLLEVWATGQSVDATNNTILVQTMGLVAAQYWLTPKLWIKAGIGGAQLRYDLDDEHHGHSDEIDSGGAVMGAVGYELTATPKFAVDLQLRFGTGTYDAIGDQIHAGMLGVGCNWY